MHPTREALERALVADPDDRALHGAYADHLIEQGDPRGEYIRLELALEDPELPPERQAAATRELAALWHAHRAEWLGPLAHRDDFQLRIEWLDGPPPLSAPEAFLSLRRGWIDWAYISEWRPEFLTALTACPLFKLVRRLELWSGSFEEDVSADPVEAAKALAGFGECRALRHLV